MGKRDTVEVLLIIMYVTAAILLMVAAYVIYIRRYRKRGRIEMMNNIEFVTSRYDRYHSKTQFLLRLPKSSRVELHLLDAKETKLKTLLSGDLESGHHTVSFDPEPLADGTYFLSLQTPNASVLRKITVEKNVTTNTTHT